MPQTDGKKLLFFFIALCTAGVLHAQTGNIEVYAANGAKGSTILVAKNTSPFPYVVDLYYLRLKNMLADPESQFQAAVPAGKQVVMATLTPKGPGKTGWDFKFRYFLGDPTHCVPEPEFPYRLPFKKGLACLVSQGYLGPISHQNTFAIDFLMEEGTPIMAAREGIVAEVKEDSNWGCPSADCARDGNYILIMHRDGTFAGYWHLQYKGVSVKVGERVSAGQVIGTSGNTGWTSGPHLHFEVFCPTIEGKQTIQTLFNTQRGINTQLEQGKLYWH